MTHPALKVDALKFITVLGASVLAFSVKLAVFVFADIGHCAY